MGGPGDFGRRSEMLVDRLADDLGLNRDQRQELQVLCRKAETSAKPIQEELQKARQAVKTAVLAGKTGSDLEPLHQQVGSASAKLCAIQSAAFGEALQVLDEDQKANADFLFEALGMIAGGRGGMPPMLPGGRPPGGPGGPGGPHDDFGPPGR